MVKLSDRVVIEYGIIKSQLRGWAKQCGHSHEAGYAKLSISDNTLVQAVKPRPPPPLDREFSVGLSAVVFCPIDCGIMRVMLRWLQKVFRVASPAASRLGAYGMTQVCLT